MASEEGVGKLELDFPSAAWAGFSFWAGGLKERGGR